ncbi:MAG: hypothetical protein KatS3mg002_0121 [Candidatus Woesearchaeota archaeon]|nr:MAG: hypothetical protein KatS3mg002_0121 [Candidatus Woesearchaeota archaeon]
MNRKDISELEAKLIKNQHINYKLARIVDQKTGNLINVYSIIAAYTQLLDNPEAFGYKTLEEKEELIKYIKSNPLNSDKIQDFKNYISEIRTLANDVPRLKEELEEIANILDLEKETKIKELINIIYSGDSKKISEYSINGGFKKSIEIFDDLSKKIDNAYLEALKTAEFNNTKSLLMNISSDLYESIIRDISEVELSDIEKNNKISTNKVYTAKSESGQSFIIKITKNEKKAKIESAAGYYLSKQEKLKDIIAPSIFPEPLQLGDYYIVIQDEIKDEKSYDIYHYIAALAMLHSHGNDAINGRIFVPEYEAKNFDEIIEDISRKESTQSYLRLKQYYKDASQELKEMNHKVLIHSDAKKDNLSLGKILDLEHLKIGNPAIDLSLYLIESGIGREHWTQYAQVYLDIVGKETATHYTIDDTNKLVNAMEKAAILTTLKELSGLYSREMGRKEQMQAELLKNYLKVV